MNGIARSVHISSMSEYGATLFSKAIVLSFSSTSCIYLFLLLQSFFPNDFFFKMNTCFFFFFLMFIYLAVLGLSCGTRDLRSLLQHVGSSSRPGLESGPPALEVWSFSH